MKLNPLTGAAAALLSMLPVAGAAETYPVNSIRIIVPYSPGGSTDIIARLIGEKLGASIGTSVVIENIAGAGGRVGTEVLRDASPDGYTIGLATAGSITIPYVIEPDLPYDPFSDFTFISNFAGYYSVLVAQADLPADTLEELIAYAKENPSALSYGTAGVGSSTHFMGEMLNQAAGISMTHIPFGGGASPLQSILTGDVQFGITSYATAKPFVDAGELKLLGVFADKRYDVIPDVPTVTEAVPGLAPPTQSPWFGMVGILGPIGMPDEIVGILSEEITKVAQDSDISAKLVGMGHAVSGGTSADLEELIRSDVLVIQALVDGGKIDISQ